MIFFIIEYNSLILLKVVKRETLPLLFSFNITFELKDYLYSFPSDYFFIVFITLIFAVYIGFNIYFRLKNNLIKF